MIYRSGSALTNVNKQTIETNRIFFHKGNRAPLRIRYAQYASLLIPGLRPGIGRACTRSPEGRFVSRGLDLCCCLRRCRAKKTSQIHLNLWVWNLFSFHDGSRWSLISMWECVNNRRYPKRYKILTIQKSVICCYIFRSISFHAAWTLFVVESRKPLQMFKKVYICNLLSLFDATIAEDIL